MKTPVYPEYPALLRRRQENRAAGGVDVDALGSLHDRHAGPRHGNRNRTRSRRERKISRPAHEASMRPGRLCLARGHRHQHQQSGALLARHVPHSEDRFLLAMHLHQYRADGPLSRRRPPGSQLRARPRRGGSRAHHRHRHRAPAQEESDSEIRDALQDRGHHHLRQRRFPRRLRQGDGAFGIRQLQQAQARVGQAQKVPRHRHFLHARARRRAADRRRPAAISRRRHAGDGAERAIDRTGARNRIRPRAGGKARHRPQAHRAQARRFGVRDSGLCLGRLTLGDGGEPRHRAHRRRDAGEGQEGRRRAARSLGRRHPIWRRKFLGGRHRPQDFAVRDRRARQGDERDARHQGKGRDAADVSERRAHRRSRDRSRYRASRPRALHRRRRLRQHAQSAGGRGPGAGQPRATVSARR